METQALGILDHHISPFLLTVYSHRHPIAYWKNRGEQILGFVFITCWEQAEDSFLLLLLLSCFSRVRLCVTPQTEGSEIRTSAVWEGALSKVFAEGSGDGWWRWWQDNMNVLNAAQLCIGKW